MKIPEYFTDKELACRCGCGMMPNRESCRKLYALRLLFGYPVYVYSGARCPARNKSEGGSASSQHLLGKAFDVEVPYNKDGNLMKLAWDTGFTAVALISDGKVHLDDGHSKPTTWNYK